MSAALLALALLARSTTPPDGAALAREVQAFYEHTRDLETRFQQTYTYGAGGRRQVSRGTLRVKKPGKMRWDYDTPEKKTIVVNGSHLVQYEPEENQVYEDPHFDASAMSAAVTFLLGRGSLEREFVCNSDAPGRLILTPRVPDPRVAQIVLTVGEGGVVNSTEVTDGSGNVNAVVFEGLKRDVGLEDRVFVLDLPKDVHRVLAPGG
ncbi:MAG TPA: outer membrane lipoprotein carrier protein LolA [Anaeromyxobacteraceae bacterium]|nr:outer membrane lipoprotein carrier protein LolA [Anaeromyxobacteraceae bacterium]